jgi:dTDP-4-dehydrorhamnose 3,5-epimerase
MTGGRVDSINGIRYSHPDLMTDARGSFLKYFPLKDIKDSLDSIAISINPNPGTVRGLHFQIEPFAEEKLITCIQGSIFDVAVDLRPESSTFGKWTSFELSSTNSTQIYLPKGLAHGFQTLVPNTIVHYSLSSIYSLEHSFSINPFGDLGIRWPHDVQAVSDRDMNGISLSSAEKKYADSLKRS